MEIFIECILYSPRFIFSLGAGYCSPAYTHLEFCFIFCYVGYGQNWMVCVFFVYDRKRKAWARRRRQSGTKPSLKTVPKEDDSDDACKKCLSVEFCSVCYCSKTNPLLILFSLGKGLISSSESSGGDESDPESSNSGDSAFSEDINKMVRPIVIV